MSFIGKEYAFVKQENFEDFVNSLGLPAEQAQRFVHHHPNQKLVKNGDTYTLIGHKEVSFKSGVTFDEEVTGRTCKTTFTLNGNTLTQVQDFAGEADFKYVRVFGDNELVVTITCSKFNGTAKRYYKAV